MTQLLFEKISSSKTISDFPQTRFQGSKLKLLPWIWGNVSFLDFDTVLDAFSGTGSVSYLFKTHGKSVTCNDILRSNYHVGRALIENRKIMIHDADLDMVFQKNEDSHNFITENFKNIYYTNLENSWLDKVINNIYKYFNKKEYKKSLLLWALFQSCIIKRPFNLFHRKNLSMRLNNVKRSFGNKTTWDKSFEYYFNKFVQEANNAIFDNDGVCRASCQNALELENNYDLVYIDTPYISNKGNVLDYYQFYHFLEGICDYYNWGKKIDLAKKHHPLKKQYNIWIDKYEISKAFSDLINHYKKSHIAISYRSDGIPPIGELISIIKRFKAHYKLIIYKNYKYVLSKNNKTHEILLIGWD